MKELTLYGWISLILLIVGGINWLLIGLFDINLVSAIFGYVLGRIIFTIVGLAALYICYLIYLLKTATP